jgi:hypothetical protein
LSERSLSGGLPSPCRSRTVARAPIAGMTATVAPRPESLAARPAAASVVVARPPEQLGSRTVVARNTPPPPPVPLPRANRPLLENLDGRWILGRLPDCARLLQRRARLSGLLLQRRRLILSRHRTAARAGRTADAPSRLRRAGRTASPARAYFREFSGL